MMTTINLNSDATALLESHIQVELAPYLGDSVIQVDVKNSDQDWFANVMVDSTRGLKAVRRKDNSIENLIQNVIEDLRSQYEMDLNQKNEIFLFDQQQEYDHYTETLTSSPFKTALKLKVLVIEDDPTASLILEKSLQSMGCQVDIMNNPRKAVDRLTHKDYDLVILDWCLPYLNGHEFLKKADAKLSVKNQGNFNAKSIPLVICSSKSSSEINLPLVSNFLFCQYWNKQLPFSTVVSSIEAALTSARKYKTKAS